MSIKLDLQYFSDEGTENETAGENNTPDAGEKQSEGSMSSDAEDNKKSFEELIRGDYRREYGKKVEEVVKNRLKNHGETKKNLDELKTALNELKTGLGIETNDPREIISHVKKRISDESKSVDANEANSDNEKENSNEEKIRGVKRAIAKLVHDVEMTKEIYPQFDIEKEFQDPRFRRMLKLTDNDPKRAFEALHHDEIMASAIRDVVKMTEERLASSIASKASRPAEGAGNAVSAVYINNDPKKLSKADRADIKRRVRMGERIVW